MSRRAFSQRRPDPTVLSSRKHTEGCLSSESHNTAGWVRRSRKHADANVWGDNLFFKHNEFEFQMVMALGTIYYKVRLAR
jgi:hypothetical protein